MVLRLLCICRDREKKKTAEAVFLLEKDLVTSH